MPRYRENPLIIPFSMLCPGISQNTKLHHLTMDDGQVLRDKSYLEHCDKNILSIAVSTFYSDANDLYKYMDKKMEYGELYVPPIPSPQGFISESSKIPWDSEIVQSFAELTNITHVSLHPSEDAALKDITYHIRAGSLKCWVSHYDQCLHHSYIPFYIWTKEGFKIKF